MKILFAVSSLGLGHATRTLTIIKHFLHNSEITIISYGDALKFLKTELLEYDNIDFIEIQDYPKLERGKGFYFYLYLFLDLIKTNFLIHSEHKIVKKMEDKFDIIFSDGRYGVYSNNKPSFLLSHQISFMPPKWLSFFKFISDLSNLGYFRNFNTVFIPDYEKYEQNLAGKLSHTFLTNFFNYEYVGIISSYSKITIDEEIDYLFIISGYLEEQKENFISLLLNEAKKLEGKKVFMLGKADESEPVLMPEENITIYPTATKELRNKLLNQAKVVISRTGYTTIMDLVELDKKAILFPTKNSTEQEYLASYHKYKNNFVICEDENNFDLNELVNKLYKTQLSNFPNKTKEAIEKIDKTIHSYLKTNFISIIIPIYNEEKYLIQTLDKLLNLNYPQEKFEIILVENGSTDRSYEIAKEYENKALNIKLIKSNKGISIAKNKGFEYLNISSDYVIFLDADTLLEREFLNELNNYLNKNYQHNIVIGTTAIKPTNSSLYHRIWFKLFDWGHRFTKTSYSIQIAKTKYAKKIKFDEDLNYSEDLDFIKNMLNFGNFFFINTEQVSTSTRRFEKDGYLKTLFYWNIQALSSKKYKINKEYISIR